MKPLPLLLCLILVLSLGGCATPPNIKEKSAASLELYENVTIASQNLAIAMNNELELRDRYKHENKVRSGEIGVKPAYEKRPKEDDLTKTTRELFSLLQMQFDQARLLHGITDRFLRIDVVDLDDAKAFSAAANKIAIENKTK